MGLGRGLRGSRGGWGDINAAFTWSNNRMHGNRDRGCKAEQIVLDRVCGEGVCEWVGVLEEASCDLMLRGECAFLWQSGQSRHHMRAWVGMQMQTPHVNSTSCQAN